MLAAKKHSRAGFEGNGLFYLLLTFADGLLAFYSQLAALMQLRYLLFAATLLAGGLHALPGRGQAGTLDPTFDIDGRVVTPIGPSADQGNAVAVQADGKIVVAGARFQGFSTDFAVLRYNPNGSLDNTFGTNGVVTTDFANGDDIGRAVAIQADGKIVVVGYASGTVGYQFALARYNTNGTLDNTFDTDGKVMTAVGAFNDLAQTVVIQPNGKIVAGGWTETNSLNASDFAVVRYNANGTLDTTFDTDGKQTTDLGSIFDLAYAMALQPDGKLVLVGETRTNPGDSDFALVRYTTAGALDPTFDTDGRLVTAMGPGNDQAFGVAIQSDGKILVAGFSFVQPNGLFALARYTPAGGLDTTFDQDGKVTTAPGGYASAYALTLQPNQKILAAGYVFINGVQNFALVRYTPVGALDTSFGTGGITTTAFVGTNEVGNAMALQPDGKIVVAGTTDFNGTNSDVAVARYRNDLSVGLPGAAEAAWAAPTATPNPFRDELLLAEVPETGELVVLDALGREVARQSAGPRSVRLDTERWPAGTYLLRYLTPQQATTQRLVKLR